MTAVDRFPVVAHKRFDLGRTGRLYKLFAAPRERRNAAWVAGVQHAVWNASVVVPSPQAFAGPDGFPYLRFDLPPLARTFESNCLSNLCADCADRGWGAAFFAAAADPPAAVQFVIATGILESLRSFGIWDGDPLDIAESAGGNAATPKKIRIAQARLMPITAASRDYLPRHTAAALRRHLVEIWKLAEPRVAFHTDRALRPTRRLVIGKKLSEFPDAETAAREVRRLLWYLPPARSVVLMPEDWTFDQMTPLSDLAGENPAA